MLSFEEIEDCFPDNNGTCEDGRMACTAQWLHDFAHAIAAKEREACAKVCVERGRAEVEKWAKIDPEYLDDAKAAAWLAEQCAAEIMMRSNGEVRDASRLPAKRPLERLVGPDGSERN